MSLPRSAAAPALLLAAVLAAYFGSLSNGFAGDARGLVLEDPRVRGVSSENLENIFTHTYWWPYGESGLYRPVTTLSYLLNYAVLGNEKQAAGYHAVNLLLHLLNVLLLYLVARRFVSHANAVWIAGLWGLHPVLTESVAAISGRPDLIAGACVLGGLLLYWKCVEASGTRQWIWLGALSLVTLAGAMAKETALALPLIVALYALLWRERRAWLSVAISMYVPVQIMLYLRGAALFAGGPVKFPFWDNPIVDAGFWTGRAAAFGVMAKEFGLLAWPARLSADYSWAQIRPEDVAWIGAPMALVVAGLLAVLWRRNRAGFFVAASALVVWLPSSNVLFPIGTIMAERFLYLPAIAFAAAVVRIASRIPSQRASWGVVVLIALAFAVRTGTRLPVWESDLTLAEASVEASPASYKTHKMLATALAESGAPPDRIVQEAERSIAILSPLPPEKNNADTWRRAAIWYQQKGDRASLRRALELLARCQAIAAAQKIPGAAAELQRMTGEIQLRLGDKSAGLDASARSVEADPANADAWRQYSDALGSAGRVEDAVVAVVEGVLLTTDAGLRSRVVELYRRGAGGSCALLPGQNGQAAINPACPEVQRHLCAATKQAIGLRIRGGRTDLAETLRTEGVRDFHCDPAALAQ